MHGILRASALICVGLAASALLATAGAAQSDKPFVAVVSQSPDTIDLSKAANPPSVRTTIENVNETLIGRGHDGKPEQTLAAWTTLDEGRVIEFRLREGVKFHSGDPFTAEDVAFSFRRQTEKMPSYKRQTADVERVEVVDRSTVRFHFRKPSISFVWSARAVTIFSKAYFDRVGEETFSAKPVGTGPYRITDYRASQFLDLEAFEEYWGGAPAVKKVRIRFVPEDSTRVAMLKSGEADLIMNTPFAFVREVEAAGFKTARAAVHPSTGIQFTFGNPNVPWADVRVRRAIAHAINADALIKGLFHGQPNRYALFAPSEVGYDPEIKPYAYDLAEAKKLLAEAGYPNGFDLPLYYWTGNYVGLRETVGVVATQLAKIGIRVEVEGYDPPKMASILRANAADRSKVTFLMLTPLMLANYSDPADALSFAFHSGSPFSAYVNKEFDGLVGRAAATLDDTARGNLVRQAGRIMYDDVAALPLWNAVSVFAMKPGVDIVPISGSTQLLPLKNIKVK